MPPFLAHAKAKQSSSCSITHLDFTFESHACSGTSRPAFLTWEISLSGFFSSSGIPALPGWALSVVFCSLQVMKTYHMYNADSISAQSKLKEAEKQEEKQIGKSVKQEDKQTPRSPDSTSNVKFEEKHVRRSSVKKIEKMKEKVLAGCTGATGSLLKSKSHFLYRFYSTLSWRKGKSSCMFPLGVQFVLSQGVQAWHKKPNPGWLLEIHG